MTLEKDIEKLYEERKPTSIHLYLRPIFILLCFLAGLYAFRILIIDEIKGKNDIDIYTAHQQMGEGNFAAAEDILKQVLAKQPNYSQANKIMGFLYLQQDDLEKALSFYEKALLYSPDNEEINSAIALIKRRMNSR